jgi:hypothetical protein
VIEFRAVRPLNEVSLLSIRRTMLNDSLTHLVSTPPGAQTLFASSSRLRGCKTIKVLVVGIRGLVIKTFDAMIGPTILVADQAAGDVELRSGETGGRGENG